MATYVAASKNTGELLGIVLHDDWGLINHAEIQKLFMPDHSWKNHDRVMCERFWNYFQKVKPLPPLIEDDEMSMYHAVLGAISQYNYDDIEFFMKYDSREMRGAEWERRTKACEVVMERRFVDKRINWVASPKTLDKIEKVLFDKVPHIDYINGKESNYAHGNPG